MSKYGKGLNREIVYAVNTGIIKEPFSVSDIKKFIKDRNWDVPQSYLNACLANGSSKSHSLTYKKYFESLGEGEYKLAPKYRKINKSNTPLKEQINIIDKEYPIYVNSWKIISTNTALKYLDKSAFIQGSGIPKVIRNFFEIENMSKGKKKYIELRYKKKIYNGYFHMSNEENSRTRLFWDKNFCIVLRNTFREYYEEVLSNGLTPKEQKPQLQLKKNKDYYDVSLFSSTSNFYNLEKSMYISFEDYNMNLEKSIKNSKKLDKVARRERLKKSKKKPESIKTITTTYKRNADVIVEVLGRANGFCERCKKSAPFIRASDGTPYLEVHHIVPLSENGDDTVENAIALCPNCHRELHFGKQKRLVYK